MASRIARNWLRTLEKPHTSLEDANFSVGTGVGPNAMPYHVIRMERHTGDSKTTVGWAATLENAAEQRNRLTDAHGVDGTRANYTYYIHDIRNGRIYSA